MAKAKSWSVKGIDGATRDKAREAARAAGLPIGAWIDQAILRARSGEFPNLAAPERQTTAPAPDPDVAELPEEVPTETTPGTSSPPDAPSAETPVETPPTNAPADPPADPIAPAAAAPGNAPRRPIVADPGVRVGRPSASNDDLPPGEEEVEPELPDTDPELRPLSAQAPTRPSRKRIFAAAAVLAVLLMGSVWLFVEMSATVDPSGSRTVAERQKASPAPAARTPAPAQRNPAAATPAVPPAVPDEVRTVRELANAGDAKAQHDFGMLYLSGRHVPKDPSQAAAWFEKAAVQGLANAQFNLGVLYQRGEGVTRNDRLAFFWYQSAAEQGMARAQHNLATAYADGRGTKVNYPKAVEWLTKAAESGLSASQFSLASLYELGFATGEPDLDQARKWFERAAAQGDAQAPERLRRIDARLAARAAVPKTPPPAAVTAAKPFGREEIMEIQTLLDAMNFNPGPVDGSLGQRTTNAIRLYQQFAGLETDGKASRELLEDLRAVAAAMSAKK